MLDFGGKDETPGRNITRLWISWRSVSVANPDMEEFFLQKIYIIVIYRFTQRGSQRTERAGTGVDEIDKVFFGGHMEYYTLRLVSARFCSLYRFHAAVTCLREQANCYATRLMSPWANLPFLLPSRSSSITARLSFSFRFFLLTVPAAPPATDMVIRVWESNLPEILLSELLSAPASGVAVDTCSVSNRENSGFDSLAGRPRKRCKKLFQKKIKIA